MMQILDRETMPAFMRLIPNELKTRIFLPGTVVAGERDGDEEGAAPIAVMLLSLTQPNEVTVEWLWVEEDFREEGIGEGLLMLAFDIAKADKRDLVTARIYTGDEELYTDALGATYFLERQFYYEREESLWVVNATELTVFHDGKIDKELYRPFVSGEPAKTKGEKANKEILPLSEVPELVLKTDADVKSIVLQNEEALDRDLSFVCLEGDTVKGACLLIRYRDSLCPICLKGDSVNTVGQLLSYCFVEAKKALEESNTITFIPKTTEVNDFFEKLFPKTKPIKITVLSASKDVPEKEMKMQEEERAYWERVEEEERNWPKRFTYVGTEFLDGSYVEAEN